MLDLPGPHVPSSQLRVTALQPGISLQAVSCVNNRFSLFISHVLATTLLHCLMADIESHCFISFSNFLVVLLLIIIRAMVTGVYKIGADTIGVNFMIQHLMSNFYGQR